MREVYLNFMLILTGISSFLLNRFGLLYPALIVLMICMAADYISGMMASKYEAIEHPKSKKYGWSSRKGLQGILKKVGYLLVIIAAVCVDYLLLNIAKSIGLEWNGSTFFGLLVTVWYILNEILSITENVGRMGLPVPSALVKVILVLKEQIEEGDE